MEYFTRPSRFASLSQRQQAARLLLDVIEERVEARVAINAWPETSLVPNSQPDLSLDAAYQALWHFEADEHRHKTELFYLDAQLELLRQMVRFLQEDRDLPLYIQNTYLKTPMTTRFFYARAFGNSLWFSGRKCLHSLLQAWRQALALHPLFHK